jgi:3-oxoacyl-(acyl-carrier-protein) synthase
MSPVGVVNAAFIGPDGFGSHETGWRPWPEAVQDVLQREGGGRLHWSYLFESEAARFARMDWMSRLGLMVVELLADGFEHFTPEDRENTGICVETAAGCLLTDIQFLRTPRPSLFTYTLPSTVIGEICIRHRFKGPTSCFLREMSAPGPALGEAISWIEQGDVPYCICLACEALETDLGEIIHAAPDALPASWGAGALLLGPDSQGIDASTLSERPLDELCRAAVHSKGKLPANGHELESLT